MAKLAFLDLIETLLQQAIGFGFAGCRIVALGQEDSARHLNAGILGLLSKGWRLEGGHHQGSEGGEAEQLGGMTHSRFALMRGRSQHIVWGQGRNAAWGNLLVSLQARLCQRFRSGGGSRVGRAESKSPASYGTNYCCAFIQASMRSILTAKLCRGTLSSSVTPMAWRATT